MSLLLLCLLARAEVVDRILYVVGDRIVTTSDVAFEQDFDLRDASPVPPMEDPAYALDQRLVDYALLRARAADIQVFKPSASELRDRYDRFRASFANPEDYRSFLRRWGMDDDRFQAFLYSRLVVERYVQRTVGLAVQREEGKEWSSLYPLLTAELRAATIVRRP